MPNPQTEQRVAVEMTPEDAQTLANLAGDYKNSSAHECLWDRLHDATRAALTQQIEEAPSA